MDALDIHTVYTRSSSGHKRAAVKEKEITFTKIKYTIYFLNVPFWKAVGGAVLSWIQQTQCCPRVTLWAPFTSSTIKTLTRNFKETIKEYAHYYVVGIKQSLIWWGWWWAGPAHADTCTLTCMCISCEPAEGCDIHQNHGDTQGEVMQLLTLFSVSWNKSTKEHFYKRSSYVLSSVQSFVRDPWQSATCTFLPFEKGSCTFVPAAALWGTSEVDQLIKLHFSRPMECSDTQLGRGRAARCGCYFSGPKWPPGTARGGGEGGCPPCCSSRRVWSIACHLPPTIPPSPPAQAHSLILWLWECHKPPIH